MKTVGHQFIPGLPRSIRLETWWIGSANVDTRDERILFDLKVIVRQIPPILILSRHEQLVSGRSECVFFRIREWIETVIRIRSSSERSPAISRVPEGNHAALFAISADQMRWIRQREDNIHTGWVRVDD
ncbi:hypothetical protein, partial [Burkholderia contaminans]|uniref:hypothetical protein n=1 Tax=Burkholderia contaminans TaxID=488447 RepID=UPI001C89CAD5